ncbi:WD repeat protein [Taphrina deformans PYCC 5710]|uniref:WD repeat protein n=1 Tax=Taphrina deformans (strain PYCC 5710 / ATCC 11124 / CBS 356.35 / IMI 108563 / JCM 9778 / NBRC 8474) TaxID=1097556 RepID=R4X6B6_TAPDE|nr:WD repeat protein [Taphrina deformans PYCC 5710]|eukprot:CCG80545.1 WD repeat protein [Taphrina deformans PYCC 5710]
MNTSNTSSFFQSADAQAKFARQAAKAGNKLGSPLQFQTKILHISNDLVDSNYVFIAESGSVARRVHVETGATSAVYRGHIAPVTKVVDLGDDRIATSSWDKTIRIFHKRTRETLKILDAHTDFVKCLLHVPALNLLLSGSSDSHIRAWSLSTYKCVYALKGHARGVESMALGPDNVLYSGGSESSIRRWNIGAERGQADGEPSWLHDTSVYSLLYNHETESLWTASADKTSRQLTVDTESKLVEETHFDHPDYVRDIIVHQGRLITACRDEDIRIFDIGSGKLLCTLQGHFSEVSSLVTTGNTLISVSLDATLRKWNLTPAGLQTHVKEQEAWTPAKEEKKEEDGAGLTAEEAAELEELMSDD